MYKKVSCVCKNNHQYVYMKILQYIYGKVDNKTRFLKNVNHVFNFT